MNLGRLWAMFMARNREYYRDRAALGWTFLFPFLIIGGFAIIFGDSALDEYKIGVFPHEAGVVPGEDLGLPDPFKSSDGLKFIGFSTRDKGLERLGHHKIDLLIKLGEPPHRYWINDASHKGYVSEKSCTRPCWIGTVWRASRKWRWAARGRATWNGCSPGYWP